MTRKLLSLSKIGRQADSEDEHQNFNPDCYSREVANPKMPGRGNTLPPTFHREPEPSPNTGLDLRGSHSSSSTTSSGAKAALCSSPISKLISLHTGGLAPNHYNVDRHATVLPSFPANVDSCAIETKRGGGELDSLLSNEEKRQCNEVQHAGQSLPEDQRWPCDFPGCTKVFKRDVHLKRHKATIHEGSSHCYFHGPGFSKFCHHCPVWVQVLESENSLRRPRVKLRHEVIPAAHGLALTLKPGAHLRIVDLHGQQVVDFMAWALPFQPDNSCEHFSASYTRYRLGGSAPPQVGECLYSNKDRPMFEILEDKVKCHDMLFMACNPSFYSRLDKPDHRSCASNMAEAMADKGFELVKGKGEDGWSGVHDPFNVFQNTPYYTLKALECSRQDDWIEMQVSKEMEHGVVVALSSCPYEEKGFNGGKVTDVGVVWEEL